MPEMQRPRYVQHKYIDKIMKANGEYRYIYPEDSGSGGKRSLAQNREDRLSAGIGSRSRDKRRKNSKEDVADYLLKVQARKGVRRPDYYNGKVTKSGSKRIMHTKKTLGQNKEAGLSTDTDYKFDPRDKIAYGLQKDVPGYMSNMLKAKIRQGQTGSKSIYKNRVTKSGPTSRNFKDHLEARRQYEEDRERLARQRASRRSSESARNRAERNKPGYRPFTGV